MSETALSAFVFMLKSDQILRERVRMVTGPQHVVQLAKDNGYDFTAVTLIKVSAEEMKTVHDDKLNAAGSWGDALLHCFDGHGLSSPD